MTAAYIQNRMPSRSVDTTPFERWCGRKPSLKHFRVFGSVAYVHIPDVKRSKLDAKAQKLLFVGYCDDRKAYRFLDPETKRITISRDARFVELQNGSTMMDRQEGENGEQFVDLDWGMNNAKVQEEQTEQLPVQEEQAQQLPTQEEDPESEDDEQVPVDQAVQDSNQRPVRNTRGVLPERLRDYVCTVTKAVEKKQKNVIGGSKQIVWKAVTKEEQGSLAQSGAWKLLDLRADQGPNVGELNRAKITKYEEQFQDYPEKVMNRRGRSEAKDDRQLGVGHD